VHINVYFIHPIVVLEPPKRSPQFGEHSDMIHKLPISLLKLLDHTLSVEVRMSLDKYSAYVELTILDEVTVVWIQQVGTVEELLVVDVRHCTDLGLFFVLEVSVEEKVRSLVIQVNLIYDFGRTIGSVNIEHCEE
jgi:hypothetical protein